MNYKTNITDNDPDVGKMKMLIVSYFNGVVTGKESTVCIKRISEAAGNGERSPGAETGHRYTKVHAGIGDGTG